MAESEERLNTNSVHPIVVSHTPIISNINEPPDECHLDKETKNKEVEDASLFKICSATKSENKSFTPMLKASVLKPPQMNLSVNNSAASTKTFLLNPPKLNPVINKIAEQVKDEKDGNHNGELSTFVPLINQTKVENTDGKSLKEVTKASVQSNSFVFGENLQERVIASENQIEAPSSSLSSNGTTTEMLFSSVSSEVKPKLNNSVNETKSLSESAREYEQSRAVKRKYDEVEIKTGEEEETNILCISCKLFAFDGNTGSWQERGRGTLRLNDFEVNDRTQSRLVFRTSGSFRVILNTKIFGKMTLDKASDKSIRITALDGNGEIKIFLIMASNEDSKLLHKSLEQRIKSEIDQNGS